MLYELLAQSRERLRSHIAALEEQLRKVESALDSLYCKVCGLEQPEYPGAAACADCAKEFGTG